MATRTIGSDCSRGCSGASTTAHAQTSWPMLHNTVPASAPSTASLMAALEGIEVGGHRERLQQWRKHRSFGHAVPARWPFGGLAGDAIPDPSACWVPRLFTPPSLP